MLIFKDISNPEGLIKEKILHNWVVYIIVCRYIWLIARLIGLMDWLIDWLIEIQIFKISTYISSYSWILLLLVSIILIFKTHPTFYPVVTRGFFPRLKWLGREADHSAPSSAEVKNALSYTSTQSIRLNGVVLS
jgi:hypothetical protein